MVYQEIKQLLPDITVQMLFRASSHVTSKINPANAYIPPKAKTLDQYPTLYREFSGENFDYYGITDETSCGDYICPLCKLGHDDEEIEGLYEKKGI
ncbi:unnamed protein product [Rhizophagus irregularis]|nr:unnamed protein product [Rhizophagus irregularis]CAB5391311.1 unnamed protein product [Rhizophagus irregularis]